MSNFKEGQIVRCINPGRNQLLVKGEFYRVGRISSDMNTNTNAFIFVQPLANRTNNKYLGYYKDRFEVL